MLAFCILSLAACSGTSEKSEPTLSVAGQKEDQSDTNASEEMNEINVTDEITEIEKGLSVAEYKGDYKFDLFLDQGGASSDRDVLSFLMNNLLSGASDIGFRIPGFGCSTISVPAKDGKGNYFGRNFDWNKCNALILVSYPENGYASISTVNTDFIKQAAGIPISDDIMKTAAVYAPLDGMNEMGLCASVNMIQDNATIDQNTEKPDITTTTVIRILLDKAATVEEAVSLLESYDMHASFGYMVHFALSDSQGNAVAVEYVGDKMSVIETPILTNFYLTEGDKYGIGTNQSHTRYEILEKVLSEKPEMSKEDVRDTLSSVSKGNFGEFESTEWSVVFDQENKTATYFHRENYERSYFIRLTETGGE